MCGIVGYVGDRNVTDVLVQGLKNLEYRGYDSAGIAVRNDKNIDVVKSVGKVIDLEKKLESFDVNYYMGIAHTRWATHGEVNEVNCHPHSMNNVVLVHNGIIENYRELKKELELIGYFFLTNTDSEIVAALIDSYKGSKYDALVYAQMKMKGSYALVIMFDDEADTLYAIRKDSPLIVGIGENENFVASDISVILPYTKKYVDIEEGEVVKITKSDVFVYSENGLVDKKIKTALWSIEDAQKGGYEHFMLKEMNEEKDLCVKLYNKFIEDGNYSDDIPDISNYNNVDIVACGSAFYAATVGKYLIDTYVCNGSIHVSVDVASEYRYKKHFYEDKSLVIVVSQSGETADTLACLRMANSLNVDTLAIVNVPSSTIAKEAKLVMPMLAGPEIAVATTKGYFSQVLELSLIAQKLGYIKGTISDIEKKSLIKTFENLKSYLIPLFEIDYSTIAGKLWFKEHIYFIGRGIDYIVGLEASLKLKEISYIHSDVYQAGELKHGPIALIDNGTPVISIITNDEIKEKSLSNAVEAQSRGASLYLLASENVDTDNLEIDEIVRVPKISEFYQPLINIIPFQFIAYEVAKLKGCDVDKPKNLAKSVTVE